MKAKKVDLTTIEFEDTPRIKGEWDQLPTVDIATINRLPWIDFNYTTDSADVNKSEQVILDLLKKSLPYSDDDRYYIYHDPNANVFSIEEDIETEDIDNLTSQILLINAKFKVRDLSSKERTELIKTRKLKLKELRSTFGAHELASALSNNMTSEEFNGLKDTAITYLADLNKEGDANYYTFNEETKEFEIRIDQDHQLTRQAVAGVIKLDSKIENPRTTSLDRRRMYSIRNKFAVHLGKLGANELADSLS